MIGWWWTVMGTLRRCRVLLLPGLVLVVAAHIAVATHSAAFGGPHASVSGPSTQHRALQGPVIPSEAQEPLHQHGVTDHVDHAVDRPRTHADTVATVPVSSDGLAALPVPEQRTTSLRSAGEAGPPGHPAPLVLNCVCRQ
ncbi:hypothetical protein ACTVZO_00320 [Streptomyces sp. IBSNAI002]|uniref:hypothetical protein n=1 Tax=Streptomyces sp. IBSNAI002 TaxID=3457500 RepID=UPI003FD3917D